MREQDKKKHPTGDHDYFEQLPFSLGVTCGDGKVKIRRLFRGVGSGSHSVPEFVFNEGFASWGDDLNVHRHVLPESGPSYKKSGLISTSTHPEVAYDFSATNVLARAISENRPGEFKGRGWCYAVNPQENAIDVEKIFTANYIRGDVKKADFEHVLHEKEMAVPQKSNQKRLKALCQLMFMLLMENELKWLVKSRLLA